MAATAQPLATQIAIDILKKGGSAIDAAIAANAALGLMEPVGCGIGGDLFAIVWDPKTKKLYGYNGSGRSPKGRTLDDLKKKLGDRKAMPSHGSLTVTVPGAVDGWFALHERFGKLPMDQVLAPATAYAREGFPVSQLDRVLLGPQLQRLRAPCRRTSKKSTTPSARISSTAKRRVQGQIFKNPDLARTYDLLAKGGRDAYYKGADRQNDRRLLQAHRRRPALRRLRGPHRQLGRSGRRELSRLRRLRTAAEHARRRRACRCCKMLEGYDLKKMGRGSADALHVMVEAKRLAFEDLGEILRRPRDLRRAGRRADLGRLRRASAARSSTWTAPTRTCRPATSNCAKATRPTSPPPTRTA